MGWMPPAHAAFCGREKHMVELKAFWDGTQGRALTPSQGAVNQSPNFNYEINHLKLSPALVAAVTHLRLAAGYLNVFTNAIQSGTVQLLYSSLTILPSPRPCVLIGAFPCLNQSFFPFLGLLG